MYRVLLVDDELLVRNYMRTLIEWVREGCVICGEATNGQMAVQQMEETSPHIIITDINMPGMDGVSLVKYLQENNPQVKVIVLSSYDKFEYVRETLNAGAVDYLLKHALSGEELTRVLRKAKDDLEREQAMMEKQKNMEENWRTMSESLSRDFVKDLVLGSEEKLPAIEGHFRSRKEIDTSKMMIMVMQVVNFIYLTNDYTEKDENTFIRSIHDLSKKIVGDERKGIVVHMDQGKFAFLLAFPDIQSENVMHQQASSIMTRLEKSLHTYFNIHVVFGISSICYRLEQVHKKYNYACEQLEEKLSAHFYGGHDLRKKGISNQAVNSLTIEQEKELLSVLELRNRAKIDDIIHSIFDMLRTKQAGMSSIQSIVGELLHIANKVWAKMRLNVDKNDFEMESLVMPQTSEITDLNEIEDWVIKRYHLLVEQLTSIQTAGYSPYVKQVIAYVREHYAGEVSLDIAASEVGITASYLGKLFREETGASFSEYVNRFRVEISKQLIKKGYKVKNIYSEVGFSSYNYFFKVFKDMENLTPQSYAKKK